MSRSDSRECDLSGSLRADFFYEEMLSSISVLIGTRYVFISGKIVKTPDSIDSSGVYKRVTLWKCT